MPAISVIVPVYRAEAYLAECIDSILSQTYSDFELILVDDGSPDDSISICRTYEAKDRRVRVLRQENRGQAAARNHGMAVAKGQWISFVDSDDVIHPQMLQLLLDAQEQTGAAISMCRMLEGENLPEDFGSHREPAFEKLTMDEDTLLRLYDREDYPGWVTCAKLIRRDLIAGDPFTEGRVYEDNEVGCRWLCRGGTLARMEHRLYFYRKNPDSTTQRSFSIKKLDYLWALESIIRYFDSLGYRRLKGRFVDRYVDAAIHAGHDARELLGQRNIARRVVRQAFRFRRELDLVLTDPQTGELLGAAWPRLSKLYWPAAAIRRILRERGLAGLWQRLTKGGCR